MDTGPTAACPVWSSLSPELLQEVCNYLDPSSLAAARMVCSPWCRGVGQFVRSVCVTLVPCGSDAGGLGGCNTDNGAGSGMAACTCDQLISMSLHHSHCHVPHVPYPPASSGSPHQPCLPASSSCSAFSDLYTSNPTASTGQTLSSGGNSVGSPHPGHHHHHHHHREPNTDHSGSRGSQQFASNHSDPSNQSRRLAGGGSARRHRHHSHQHGGNSDDGRANPSGSGDAAGGGGLGGLDQPFQPSSAAARKAARKASGPAINWDGCIRPPHHLLLSSYLLATASLPPKSEQESWPLHQSSHRDTHGADPQFPTCTGIARRVTKAFPTVNHLTLQLPPPVYPPRMINAAGCLGAQQGGSRGSGGGLYPLNTPSTLCSGQGTRDHALGGGSQGVVGARGGGGWQRVAAGGLAPGGHLVSCANDGMSKRHGGAGKAALAWRDIAGSDVDVMHALSVLLHQELLSLDLVGDLPFSLLIPKLMEGADEQGADGSGAAGKGENRSESDAGWAPAGSKAATCHLLVPGADQSRGVQGSMDVVGAAQHAQHAQAAMLLGGDDDDDGGLGGDTSTQPGVQGGIAPSLDAVATYESAAGSTADASGTPGNGGFGKQVYGVGGKAAAAAGQLLAQHGTGKQALPQQSTLDASGASGGDLSGGRGSCRGGGGSDGDNPGKSGDQPGTGSDSAADEQHRGASGQFAKGGAGGGQGDGGRTRRLEASEEASGAGGPVAVSAQAVEMLDGDSGSALDAAQHTLGYDQGGSDGSGMAQPLPAQGAAAAQQQAAQRHVHHVSSSDNSADVLPDGVQGGVQGRAASNGDGSRQGGGDSNDDAMAQSDAGGAPLSNPWQSDAPLHLHLPQPPHPNQPISPTPDAITIPTRPPTPKESFFEPFPTVVPTWASLLSVLTSLKELRLLGYQRVPPPASLAALAALPHLELLDVRLSVAPAVQVASSGPPGATTFLDPPHQHSMHKTLLAPPPPPQSEFMRDAHLEALSNLTHLTVLHLNCVIGVTSRGLAKLQALTRLKSLSLCDALDARSVTGDDLKALLSCLPSLRSLALGRATPCVPMIVDKLGHVVGLGSGADASAMALGTPTPWGPAFMPCLKRLKYLGLQYIHSMDEQLLSSVSTLTRLVALDVEGLDLSYGEAMMMLTISQRFMQLRHMALGACVLYDAHLASIAQLTQLKQLTLQQVDVRTRDLSGWTCLAPLTCLTRFEFQEWNNPVLSVGNLAVLTDESVTIMAEHWRNLVQLRYLGKVVLTSQARGALASLPHLTQLCIISPDGTRCVGMRPGRASVHVPAGAAAGPVHSGPGLMAAAAAEKGVASGAAKGGGQGLGGGRVPGPPGLGVLTMEDTNGGMLAGSGLGTTDDQQQQVLPRWASHTGCGSAAHVQPMDCTTTTPGVAGSLQDQPWCGGLAVGDVSGVVGSGRRGGDMGGVGVARSMALLSQQYGPNGQALGPGSPRAAAEPHHLPAVNSSYPDASYRPQQASLHCSGYIGSVTTSCSYQQANALHTKRQPDAFAGQHLAPGGAAVGETDMAVGGGLLQKNAMSGIHMGADDEPEARAAVLSDEAGEVEPGEAGAGGLQVRLLLPHTKLSSCNGYLTHSGTPSLNGSQGSEESVNWVGGSYMGGEDCSVEAMDYQSGPKFSYPAGDDEATGVQGVEQPPAQQTAMDTDQLQVETCAGPAADTEKATTASQRGAGRAGTGGDIGAHRGREEDGDGQLSGGEGAGGHAGKRMRLQA